MPRAKGVKQVAANRKALHDYFVLERFEAGVELFGTEVKSIRAGTVNLKDSFCTVKNGELFAYGIHISPYEHGSIYNRDPDRPKRLLMHRREITKLYARTKQDGLTLVPLSLYFKDSRDRQNDKGEKLLMSNPIVTIEMEDGGIIRAELYPEIAPNTVRNFISLVKKGFYDGVIFHRVIPGFMIQGGDPTGTGMGGPGYSIEGEFTSNGFQNDLKHTRGVLSMARAMDPNSAGSQFFIMHMDAPHLDKQYAAFGKVTEGMDVVDAIARTPRSMFNDKPTHEQKMKTVTVETFGVEYPEPETC